jgi:hypothetical protein
VDTLIANDVPFNQIEEYVNEVPVDSEQRSVLWLLACVPAANPASRERVIAQTRGLVPY